MSKNILDIFNNCNFKDLNSENFEDLILDNLPDDFDYKFFYGASKLVILPEDEEYVIKIPFSGYPDDNNNKKFYRANIDDNRYWDYCFTELLYYNQAKKHKVDKAFAKIKLIGIINNYPIYIQQKAETYEYRNIYLDKEKNLPSSISHTYKIVSKNHYKAANLDWTTDLYNYYGEKQFNKIMNFIKFMGIGDLHDDNIGYIGLKPVLIDYSDFFS